MHILLDGTKNNFDIQPAIADRSLISNVVYIYPYITNKVKGASGTTPNIGSALMRSNKIFCNGVGVGY